jgi:hypothetical protein
MGKVKYTLAQLEPLARDMGYTKEQLRELDRYLPRKVLGDCLMAGVPPEQRTKGGIVGKKRAINNLSDVMLQARLGAAQEYVGALSELTILKGARKKAGEVIDVVIWLDGPNSNGIILGPNKKEADFDLAEDPGEFGTRFIFFEGDDGKFEGHTPIKGVATAVSVTINDLRAAVDSAVKAVLAPSSGWLKLEKTEQDVPILNPLPQAARARMLLHECGIVIPVVERKGEVVVEQAEQADQP